jgi:RNA polymerase sigma factor (sigma-70 family)
MINLAINNSKKNKRTPYQQDISEINETEIETDEPAFEMPFPPDKLMEWIQSLPEGYRMVFNLYVFEEQTHKAIGELLEISENTSKTQLLKARKWLQKRIQEYSINSSINADERKK